MSEKFIEFVQSASSDELQKLVDMMEATENRNMEELILLLAVLL